MAETIHIRAAMGKRRLIDDLTAAVLVVLALALVWFGGRILLFSLDEAKAQRDRDPASAEARLDGWTRTWPLSSSALNALVEIETQAWRGGRDDGHTIDERLAELLARRPADGAAWLALANVRLARGAPFADVVAAFDMSSWVAPRESQVMLARVDLGLRIWERLDYGHQLSIVADLIGIGPMLSEVQIARLQPLLLTRSDAEREALSSAVAARSGGTLPPWAVWLGLGQGD